MSDTAMAMLQKMRESRPKEGETARKINPEDFYVRLIILAQRRRQLAVFGIGLFFLLFTIIFKHERLGAHWQVLILPVLFLGGLSILIPSSEEWEYRPWQTRARQYERHQMDRGGG